MLAPETLLQLQKCNFDLLIATIYVGFRQFFGQPAPYRLLAASWLATVAGVAFFYYAQGVPRQWTSAGVPSMHQIHYFVSASLLATAPLKEVLRKTADALVGGERAALIVDNTALPKQGKHSVGITASTAACLASRLTAKC
jgi:hypothetical protein